MSAGGAMEQLYQQLILDHAKERHGHGLREGEGPTGESFQVNPTCGDEVRLRVRLDADGARVADVSWEGHGCSISQASTSVLTDVVTGADLAEVHVHADRFGELMHGRGAPPSAEAEATLGDAVAFAGVARYPARVKCALLGWMALQDALIRAGSSGTTHEREHDDASRQGE